MTETEYLAGFLAEYEHRGAPVIRVLLEDAARRFAAIDRALGPTPTIGDLGELRLWRRTLEMFGPASCNVYRRCHTVLAVVP